MDQVFLDWNDYTDRVNGQLQRKLRFKMSKKSNVLDDEATKYFPKPKIATVPSRTMNPMSGAKTR